MPDAVIRGKNHPDFLRKIKRVYFGPAFFSAIA